VKMGGVKLGTRGEGAGAPVPFHWVWKEFRKGLSDVFFGKINKETYGTEPVKESKHKPVDVPTKKKAPEAKFGWIAPDGRYFQCNCGGHSMCDAAVQAFELAGGRPAGKERWTLGNGSK